MIGSVRTCLIPWGTTFFAALAFVHHGVSRQRIARLRAIKRRISEEPLRTMTSWQWKITELVSMWWCLPLSRFLLRNGGHRCSSHMRYQYVTPMVGMEMLAKCLIFLKRLSWKTFSTLLTLIVNLMAEVPIQVVRPITFCQNSSDACERLSTVWGTIESIYCRRV